MSHIAIRTAALSLVVGIGGGIIATAQEAAAPPLKGSLERVKVQGKSLEGNLMGESSSP
jgi:hypothetical protein